MPTLWLDGHIVSTVESGIGLATHALHYGTAVFDGGKFYPTAQGRTAVFRLGDHLRRLLRGARAAFLETSFSEDELRAATLAVVAGAGRETGYVRQIVFAGEGAMGLAARNPTHTAVMTWDARPPGSAARLRIAGFGHDPGWLPGVKLAGHYARAFLARREAERTGCDDVIFLAPDGTVAEATAANVFAVIDGVLRTPPASAPILPGITRDTVLVLAGEARIPVAEAPIRRADLLGADEVFLASSASEVLPVVSIEGRTIEAPGPVTREIALRYASVVRGNDDRHLPWLELVS